jgi:uncharacterized protein (DUF305 family)
MWKRTVLIGAVAMAALVVAAGCSNSSDSGSEDQSTGPMTSTSATAAATTSAPGAQAHNDADVMFSQHMIPHHQQAIEMSDILLAKQGIDPKVTELATKIKAAQDPEIQQMRGWLDEWGNPPMSPMPSGDMPMPSGDMNMPEHGGMPGMSSGQGMMSEQDMTSLKNAQGVEASRLFLTQMTKHHQGAITMAQREISDGQYPPAVEMARTIVATQQQEIDTMNGILGSL